MMFLVEKQFGVLSRVLLGAVQLVVVHYRMIFLVGEQLLVSLRWRCRDMEHQL